MRKNIILSLCFVFAVASVSLAQNHTEEQFNDAYFNWDKGDYISALEGMISILNSSEGGRYLEKIALLSGELYNVDELTPDGRNPGFSHDGRYALYESVVDGKTMTRVVDITAGNETVAEIEGENFMISSTGKAAFTRVKDSEELRKAVDGYTLALNDRRNRAAFMQARQSLFDAMTRNREIFSFDLSARREKKIMPRDFVVSSMIFGADGETIYFVGGARDNAQNSDIYSFSESNQTPVKLTDGSRNKDRVMTGANGAYLIYGYVNRSPIPVSSTPSGGRNSNSGFAIKNLADGSVKDIDGIPVEVSRDGSTLLFINGNNRSLSVYTMKLEGGLSPVLAKSGETVANPRDPNPAMTFTNLNNPSISSDGSKVAFEIKVNADYEVYVIDRDGQNEKRLSSEIQHDRFPAFVGAGKVIAAKGEGRHRRSFLYDINTGKITKLFHNNTVRTFSPEYQWVVSPDDTKLLIVAERDGDTISPARGVYLLDLNRRVTRAELLERLETNLASEKALRSKGEKIFAPIHEHVAAVTDEVTVGRIYNYEKSLYEFGSKHISRPGNKMASEYLYNAYKSFGYTPEYQWFQPSGYNVETANVIATLPGTVNPELAYIISSHFDSVNRGPGADDNTSGTAALLEAARVLAKNPMPATIIFASFTGEEAGLRGSREFVRRAVESGMQIVGALNNDMLGWSNDHRLDNTIRYSNPGIRDIQHAAAFLFTNMITYDALYYKGTDAHAYYEAYGDIVGGIGSYPVLGNPHYHQATDRLETINHELVKEVSKTSTATLMLLASSPSRIKGLEIESADRDAMNIHWDASPEKGIASYIVSYHNSDGSVVTMTVNSPKAKLPVLEEGALIKVKAVNTDGMEGWDWARLVVGKQ